MGLSIPGRRRALNRSKSLIRLRTLLTIHGTELDATTKVAPLAAYNRPKVVSWTVVKSFKLSMSTEILHFFPKTPPQAKILQQVPQPVNSFNWHYFANEHHKVSSQIYHDANRLLAK